jgi:SAM-dependent methyltransferase
MEPGVIHKDYFSDRSALYAKFRPAYPAALFETLAGLPRQHDLALDCGTGSGQAAVGLAPHFTRVIATDASDAQLAHAALAPNVEYRCARAEASGLPDGSVDLVTAAQALHWFDTAAFFAEARRVLAGGGVIAVWGYGDPVLEDKRLHAIVHEFNRGLLEPWWYPERKLLLSGYRTVDFPFAEVSMPELSLEQRWNLSQLAGLLRTWSATARYSAHHGIDPVVEVEAALAKEWVDPARPRTVRWPLYVRAGRAESSV